MFVLEDVWPYSQRPKKYETVLSCVAVARSEDTVHDRSLHGTSRASLFSISNKFPIKLLPGISYREEK